jgi:hypothetical protein
MAAAVTPTTLVDRTSLNRSSFPKGFIFGTASSSYQVSFVAFCVLLYIWRVETDFCNTFKVCFRKNKLNQSKFSNKNELIETKDLGME